MLLFPTHFFTEGIPGTVIDALRASYWEMGSGFKSVIEFAKELRHWIETDE